VTETIDAEATEELVVRPEAPPPTLFNTDDPNLIIAKAASVADALKRVITNQKMSVRIGQSDYVKVEGWTTLGALLGVFTKVESTNELTDDEGVSQGWEAAVVVVNNQGVEIGRAEAQCLRAEKNWKGRDDFALRSMAQTRAMGKALRMVLGWIAVMAGYEATPAEEMPTEGKKTVAGREVSDDVPFDDTGGAQGQTADGMKAHGNTGTGAASTTETREEANERRRLELTDRLCRAAGQLGKLRVTEDAIEKDRTSKKVPAHLTWLEKQVDAAEVAVATQRAQEKLGI